MLGDTMEDWSVIYKCGAQDGIRGMCKAIWCGTVTDGVKGIICDVRACAFYKDPLCTEGPDARIRPIAIGCALRRLCCKAGCKRLGKGPWRAIARALSLRRARSATTTRESLDVELAPPPARRARAPTLDAMDDC